MAFDDPSFSLSLAVQAATQALGGARDLVDIHHALGLPLLMTASPTDAGVREWALLARDAFLMQAAPCLGLTIRALHPPEAARGLACAAEFRQHFDASYAPLIRRALEHQQIVLAWQGWEREAEGLWGIITAEDSRGVGFSGFPFPVEPSPDDRPPARLLHRPPIQFYVIESITCTVIDEIGWAQAAVRHTAAALQADLGARFGVLTGAPAYRRWAKVLRDAKPPNEQDFPSIFAHAELARSVLTGLECFFLGLRKMRDFGIAETLDVQRLSDYARSIQQEMTQVRELLAVISAPGAITNVPAVIDTLHRTADLTERTSAQWNYTTAQNPDGR